MPDVRGRRGGGQLIRGEIPDPFATLLGCRFAPRCLLAELACGQPQTLRRLAPEALARCWKARLETRSPGAAPAGD